MIKICNYITLTLYSLITIARLFSPNRFSELIISVCMGIIAIGKNVNFYQPWKLIALKIDNNYDTVLKKCKQYHYVTTKIVCHKIF